MSFHLNAALSRITGSDQRQMYGTTAQERKLHLGGCWVPHLILD